MIEIKRIEQNELPDLALLLEELTGKPCTTKTMAKNFEWMAQNSDYILLGAICEGELAGSLMGIICHDLAGECQPFMVIENVIVGSKFRGRGIGKKLMQAIETIGREANCYYTMLVSGAQRTEAHRFYQAAGYKLDVVQGFKKYLEQHD